MSSATNSDPAAIHTPVSQLRVVSFPFAIRLHPLYNPPRVRRFDLHFTRLALLPKYCVLGRVYPLPSLQMVTLEAYPKIEVAALKDIPVPINISTQPLISLLPLPLQRQSARLKRSRCTRC